jgi:hypothetical protein
MTTWEPTSAGSGALPGARRKGREDKIDHLIE